MESFWRTEMATNREQLARMRAVWEHLLAQTDPAHYDADPDRLLSQLDTSREGMEPWVVLLYHHDQPVLLAVAQRGRRPLRIHLGPLTLARIHPYGIQIPHGGIIGPGCTDPEACRQLLLTLEKTLAEGGADLVSFQYVPVATPLSAAIAQCPHFSWRGHVGKVMRHWTMEVPESLDLFYKKHSRKSRETMRRRSKKLFQAFADTLEIRVIRHVAGLAEGLREAAAISATTYQAGLSAGIDDKPTVLRRLSVAAERGWLDLAIMRMGGVPCAFQLGLRYGNTYYLPYLGYDPQWGGWGVGNVLFLHVLERLCADSEVRRIDFCFGDYEYKQRYGDGGWEEANIFYFAARPGLVGINLLLRVVDGLAAGVQAVMKKTGGMGRFVAWRNKMLTKRKKE